MPGFGLFLTFSKGYKSCRAHNHICDGFRAQTLVGRPNSLIGLCSDRLESGSFARASLEATCGDNRCHLVCFHAGGSGLSQGARIKLVFATSTLRLRVPKYDVSTPHHSYGSYFTSNIYLIFAAL